MNGDLVITLLHYHGHHVPQLNNGHFTVFHYTNRVYRPSSFFDEDGRLKYGAQSVLEILPFCEIEVHIIDERDIAHFRHFCWATNVVVLDGFNQPLNDALKPLTNLKILNFGNTKVSIGNEMNHFNNKFNHSLCNSLITLTKLEILKFGHEFNQPLDKSLNSLINLKTLIFGRDFNQPLSDTLKNLSKLRTLTFGDRFNQPLGDSLSTMRNLQSLELGVDFNQLLGDHLPETLQDLVIGNAFNQPLGVSLKPLTNLKTLFINLGFHTAYPNKQKFNQPLGNSLITLTNLEFLFIGDGFDQPLGDSLSSLINLDFLYLGRSFNRPLLGSLSSLTRLKTLDMCGYNQFLDKDLSTLTNLTYLRLSEYREPLYDSLSTLSNLKELSLHMMFRQRYLGNSLSALKNLDGVEFGFGMSWRERWPLHFHDAYSFGIFDPNQDPHDEKATILRVSSSATPMNEVSDWESLKAFVNQYHHACDYERATVDFDDFPSKEEHIQREFMVAIKKGCLVRVRIDITEWGVNVNFVDQRHTPVSLASSLGHADILQVLIENGGEVNPKFEDLPSSLRYSPLEEAVKGNHVDCVEMLKMAGAS